MLQALVRAVDALVAFDVSEACDSEIRETVIAVRREIDRQDALVAHLLAAVHQRGLAAGDGASSTATWMRSQTGQRVHEAQASLQAGLACATLQLTAKAWIQGEISSSSARTICRGRRDGHEGEYAGSEATMVDYAAARDFGGLDAMIRHYKHPRTRTACSTPASRTGGRSKATSTTSPG
jgi:hypothetical protein